MFASDAAQVNDRVTELVKRLRAAGVSVEEDALHPAVIEAETSAGVAGFAREQLAYTRSGRERIAKALRPGKVLSLDEALGLTAAPVRVGQKEGKLEAEGDGAPAPAAAEGTARAGAGETAAG